MDAVCGMEGNGPSSGKLRLDAVMCHMMGLNPDRVPMLHYAHEKGLGEIDIENITIKGELTRIPRFKVPSRTLVQFITPLTSRYYDFLAVKPRLNPAKCIKCWECVEKYPVSALTRGEYPLIDKNVCVSCFCCVEVCESHAMEVPSRARDLFDRLLLK